MISARRDKRHKLLVAIGTELSATMTHHALDRMIYSIAVNVCAPPAQC